ncbi:hypothetical protein [Rickettsia endosymbiont of Orchestes rusci]|uniref:hypothetical protein n=1 Tax=Rickettsia endosymbiont of Orchestes rusci TaxID=3066250 RepID=UPI00313BB1B5
MVINDNLKIEVIHLCNKILNKEEDMFEAFYKLYPLLDYFIINAVIISETEVKIYY